MGFPVFFSLFHIIGISLIAAFNVVYARRRFGEGFTRSAFLLSALFLTSPTIFLSNYFLRTSKIVAGVSIFFLLWGMIEQMTAPSSQMLINEKRKFAAWTALAVAAMVFCDEQGVFLAVLGFAFLSAYCCICRGNRRLEALYVASVLLGVILIYIGYDLYFGPKIISMVNGGAGNFEYHRRALLNALRSARLLKGAWGLTMDTLGFQFGSLDFSVHSGLQARSNSFYPFSTLILGLMMAGLALPTRSIGAGERRTPPIESFIPLLMGLISCAAVVGMFLVMIAQHPPILWEDVRRTYYWIPTSVLILIASTFSLGYWSMVVAPRHLEVLLVMALALNLLKLPAHRRFIERGSLEGYIEETDTLKECLRHPKMAGDFMLSPSSALWCQDYRRSILEK